MGNTPSKQKKGDKAVGLDTVNVEAPGGQQGGRNITVSFKPPNPSNNPQPTAFNVSIPDASTPSDNQRAVGAETDQWRDEAEATTTLESKRLSLSKQRLLDGGILFAQFTSKLAGAVGVLGPLKAACECVELTLQTVNTIKRNNDDSDALEKKLKFHLGTLRGHVANLEEDKEPDMEGSAASEPLKAYIKDLDEIYRELSQIQSNTQSMPRKLMDITINRETITEKTRKMDEALKNYTMSLQQLVANIVEQMQGNLTQLRKEFQEEAKKTKDNKLKAATAYGDQHKLCMPGTRKKTLAAIHNWINDENSPHKIFYFLDVAGSGKSTVSKQVAQDLKGRFVARFFFSRDTEETMSTNTFCTTVSDAIAFLNPQFDEHVAKFRKRRDLASLPLEEQFEGLMINPLKTLNQPVILVIDAIDECNNANGRRHRLLEMLHNQQLSIPLLRIFITGRPEPDIKRRAGSTVGYSNFSKLEGENNDVEEYIHVSLKDFPEDQRLIVIRGADGLFIWARLACDMLHESIDREGLLMELRGEVSLDDLYRIAIKEAMPKDQPSQRAVLSILAMILAAQRPLSIESLEILSPDQLGVVESAVGRLGSLLIYANRKDPIRFLHVTFRDFITNQSKAGPYFVQVKLGHYKLASRCITVIGDKDMQESLKGRSFDLVSSRKVIYQSKENH